MTTYAFQGFSVDYTDAEPGQNGFFVETLTLEIVFSDEATTETSYIVTDPGDDSNLPFVDITSDEAEVRIDGISFNQDDFLTGDKDDVQFGEVTWDGQSKTSIALILSDWEDQRDYVFFLFGSVPTITSQGEFDDFVSGGTIDYIGAAGGSFGEGETFRFSDFAPAIEADVYNGTDAADFFDGGEGDDVLTGNAGNDTLVGGAGSDTIYAGDGDDVVYGDDLIF